MANEYSYNELMEMQDRAIKRVHDMQERARRTVEEAQTQVAALNAPSSSSESSAPKPHPKYTSPVTGKPPFKLDGDKAAILPILLLLWREGADNILLVALMYIMA